MDDLIEAVNNAIDAVSDAINEAHQKQRPELAREIFKAGAQLIQVKGRLIEERDARRAA